jgi:hypothetical protein
MHENYTAEGRYVPEELQDKYVDIKLVKSDNFGGEQLFGVEKESGDLDPIDWAVIIEPIEEQKGVLAPRWSDEDLEKYKNNPELWQAHKENAFLRSEVERQARKIERHDTEMRDLRSEIAELRRQVQELSGETPTAAGAHAASAREPRTRPPAVAPPTTTGSASSRVDRPPATTTGGGRTVIRRRPTLRQRVRGAIAGEHAVPPPGVVGAADRETVAEREDTVAVVEEDEPGRDRIVAGMLVGGLLVGVTALVTYALTRHTGHDFSEVLIQNKMQHDQLLARVSELKSQLRVHDAADVRKIDVLAQQVQQAKSIGRAALKTLHENHHLLLGLKHHEAREAVSGVSATPSGSRGFEFPWNWAKDQYGANRAERMLHVLGERAMRHGHSVSWFLHGFLPNGARREIMMVDGTTNTQSVVGVISQYR